VTWPCQALEAIEAHQHLGSDCLERVPLTALSFTRGIKLRESQPASVIIKFDRPLLQGCRKNEEDTLSSRGSPKIRCETSDGIQSSQGILSFPQLRPVSSLNVATERVKISVKNIGASKEVKIYTTLLCAHRPLQTSRQSL